MKRGDDDGSTCSKRKCFDLIFHDGLVRKLVFNDNHHEQVRADQV